MEGSSKDRIIVLVDMDCFYVQVEQKLCPEYQNKPCAVVQYNTWKGGGIIAVNYEARAKGVTRFLRGAEAEKVCPDIHLFRVPEIRGKADLTRYREAGASVLDVLCQYSDCVERASIDEAYLDLTSVINAKLQDAPHVTSEQLQNTFVVGWEGEDSKSKKEELEKWLQMIYEEEHLYNDRMLALAAVIVEEMRTAVYEKTGYRCSAGIAHNKMLAKLSCGVHKPNKQTVLPHSSIQILFKTMPIKKVRNLGGKLGEAIVKRFNVEKMGDLTDVTKSQFANEFGEKTGHWLYNLVRGMDNEPVTARQLPKSIGCGKNFPGKKSLSTKIDVTHWLKQLATELEERLIKDQTANRRFARLLTISVRINENGVFSVVSRSCPIHAYNTEKLAHDALLAISKLNTSSSDLAWKPSIWSLSMAASKFEDKLDYSHCSIHSYFSNKSSDNKETTNQSEGSSSKSISSTNQDKAFEEGNIFTSKSTKIENPDKSIISFFKRKQVTETIHSFKEMDSNVDEKEKDKELDSCFSGYNAPNSDISCKQFSVKTVLPVSENSETILPNKQSIASFLTVKEITKAEPPDYVRKTETNIDLTIKKKENSVPFLSDVIKNSNEISVTNEKEASLVDENFETVLPDKQNKSLGFFAKKLKERSEFIFDIELETSCDSENNELQDNFSHLEASSSVSTNDHALFNVNVMNDTYSGLDPELTKICEQCSKVIPIWEEMEHSDYHVALNLSKEFSSKSTSQSSCLSKSSVIEKKTTKSKSDRKRASATKSSSQSKKPFVKYKTLDAFFR